MIGLGTDDALEPADQGRHRQPADQAELDRRLRPLGSVLQLGPVARLLRHRLPAARQGRGYAVPDQAMTRALDNLGNQVSYAADFSNGGEDVAYALYDLARGRPGRHRRPALLPRSPSRRLWLAAGQGPARCGARPLWRSHPCSDRLCGGGRSAGDTKDRATATAPTMAAQLRDTAAVLALAAEFTPVGRRSRRARGKACRSA